MMLLSSKSFTQVAIPTAEGTLYEDSLICFPIRYAKFIKEDLITGDRYKKKAEELSKIINQKETENASLKKEVNMLIVDKQIQTPCPDSTEMKNAKIAFLYQQWGKTKKQNKFLTGAVILLAALFAIK